MSAQRLTGAPVAAEIRSRVRERVQRLRELGTVPTLGTVLMSDNRADHRFMTLKHEACAALDVATRDVRLDPEDAPSQLYSAVEGLSTDPDVHAVFVQTPLPDPVETMTVRERIAPVKDVDCFHPENLGRLVADDPRYVPATPAAVLRLLSWYDVPTAGRHAVVVGRTAVIGRPLSTLLARDASPGNATVTVCHSRTRNLAAQTRRADLLVTAAGTPELVDGSMLSPGVDVVDVSATHQSVDGSEEPRVVGDVAADSAADVADSITPVPGGVGPVTVACLLQNVVTATERQVPDGGTGVDTS